MDKLLTCSSDRNICRSRIDYIFSHWQEVDHFIVEESDKPFSTCRLDVYFSGGRRISIYYGSLAIAWDIIHQPLFFGLKVFWFGRGYEI
jgi:hypothetical protein